MQHTKSRAIYLLLLSIFMVNAAQAATITVDPLNSLVDNGDIFFVDITGDSFPTTQGGGFSLAFDPLVINILSVSIDSGVWDFVNESGTIDNVAGTLLDVLVSAFPGVDSGNFIVATLGIQAVGFGVSALNVSATAINPWASDGSPINPGFTAGSVNIASAVPIPATLWLFISGFLSLALRARKNN